MAAPEAVTADDRARVVTAAALKAAEALQISKTTLGRILGLSPASVTRLASGTELRPDTKPYELALLLLRLELPLHHLKLPLHHLQLPLQRPLLA